MAHFVLVHGMFHGGWCWRKLGRLLEARGHSITAPDLAGCGTDPTPPGEVTLARWADDIARIVAASAEPVVLVGHSRGGLVISQAAEQTPENISALVYLTALMLPNGGSPMTLPQIMEEEGFATDQPMIVPRFNAEGTAMLPPEDAAELFYGSCSPEDRDWAMPQIGHEPLGPMGSPLALTEARWGSLPKIYIETTEDKTLAIAAQRAMIARTRPDEVITMETDHMPIFSHAEELAAILDDIATRHAVAKPPVTA